VRFEKLREVICPVLKLREEKRTFVKVEGGKVDFFVLSIKKPISNVLYFFLPKLELFGLKLTWRHGVYSLEDAHLPNVCHRYLALDSHKNMIMGHLKKYCA